MVWIESHQGLGNHPKLKKLCRVLNINQPQAVGHLQYLWWWAVDYCDSGDLTRFDALDIAIASMWEGDPDEYVDALIRCGWIDRALDETYIHDWHVYIGKLLERRQKDADRKRESRGRPADIQGTAHGRRVDGVRNPTVPNRTEPNPTEQNQGEHLSSADDVSEKAAPVPMYSADFEEFWKRYPSGHGVKKSAYGQWKRMGTIDRNKAHHALDAWIACQRWHEGYIKSCELWLRDRLWDQEPPPPKPTAAMNGRHKGPDFEQMVREMENEERLGIG